MLIILPPVAVFFSINGHVDYMEDSGHPLQKIYKSSDFDLTSNDMMLKTDDGYNVWVSEITLDEPKAIIIYLSGIHQPSVTYFYGHAKWMKDNGYASFLLEVRGHGKSDGTRIALGYEEVNDVKAVMDYIDKKEIYTNVPIVIHGVSMGGAIAVNSFGQLKDIDGLIAMSAYSTFEDVVIDTMKKFYMPKFICNIEKPLVKLSLKAFFGKKADEITPLEQMKNIGDRPALFIVSQNDTSVPPENTQRLLEAAPDHCELWVRESENAGHFIILNNDFENVELDEEYTSRILNFIENEVLNE